MNMLQHEGETITETHARVSSKHAPQETTEPDAPLTYLKRLERGGYKQCFKSNRNAFPVYVAPAQATPEMVAAVRLHLEIRSGEDAPIDIEALLNDALDAWRH